MSDHTSPAFRLKAIVRLSIVALLVLGGGCRIGGKSGKPATAPPAPAGEAPTKPGEVPKARTDSVVRDSVLADSLHRLAQTADSLRIADSIRVAEGAEQAAIVAKAAADSVKRADSLARAASSKKPRPATRNCVLDFSESPPETRLLYSRISENVSNTFIGGGFVGHCQGENNKLSADSAEQFQAPGIVNLYGNVVYEEPGKIRITASHATYFTREGRLYADGEVTASHLSTGSRFWGPSVEYYRATPERPESRMIAPSRSNARIIQRDSLGRLSPPTDIVANRFEDAGESLLLAWGDVVINRDQLNARADSSSFDKIKETARLIRGARITNQDTSQRFVLVGDTIDLFSTNRQLDRVLALHKANATSADMVLESEKIDIRLDGQALKEAFAFGAGRARAKTSQQDVEADSLRIILSDRQVRQVHAIGGALAIGSPDTLKIQTSEKDILRGDSIFAYFDSTHQAHITAADAHLPPGAGADSTQRPKIREIRALGNASSLFHIANSKGKNSPPGINYAKGGRIVISFDTGSVSTVDIDSSATGVYLEAEPDSLTDTTTSGSKKKTATKGTGGASSRKRRSAPSYSAPALSSTSSFPHQAPPRHSEPPNFEAFSDERFPAH